MKGSCRARGEPGRAEKFSLSKADMSSLAADADLPPSEPLLDLDRLVFDELVPLPLVATVVTFWCRNVRKRGVDLKSLE